MSELSSDNSIGIAFDERTTNASFQERLLQAKSSSEFDPLNKDTRFIELFDSDDTVALRDQLDRLSKKVLYMEDRVAEKERKLKARRNNRKREAAITNMTPEERAAFVEQQEMQQARIEKRKQKLREKIVTEKMKEIQREAELDDNEEDNPKEDEEGEDQESDQDALLIDEKPDWDVVYEYLLLLDNESAEDEMSFGPDFMKPNAEIRQKAFESEQVKKQTVYSGITIIKSTQKFEDDQETESGSIRHCKLTGTSFEMPFQVEFDVLEPSMVMQNLDFEVNIEMQLAVGNTLQKIKDECNIMGFFQLLVHYAKLEIGRRDIFSQLMAHYKDTQVNVVMLSQTKLQFEGAVDCGISLLLSWKIVEANVERERLDANVVNHVQPNLIMEAVALPAVIAKDVNGALDKVNDAFIHSIVQKGVFNGTKYIVDNILSDK